MCYVVMYFSIKSGITHIHKIFTDEMKAEKFMDEMQKEWEGMRDYFYQSYLLD